MISKLAFEGSKNIKNLFKLKKYNKDFKKNNPDYFEPEGLLVFFFFFWVGKTLSAIELVEQTLSAYDRVVIPSKVA